MKYGYLGSGHFAARCLELLSEWQVPAWIVTSPAKSAGRGNKLTPTPVRIFADASPKFEDIPLMESPDASRDENVMALSARFPVDFCFVVDFGQVIREPLLRWDDAVGCLNIHPSMLPRYRGAAPVQRALMNCEAETGVTVFKLASDMDSGPVLVQRKLEIGDGDDAASLLERAAVVGVDSFIEIASNFPMNEWKFSPQDDSLATYAPKISREEERIDWSRSAGEISGLIRGLSPKPGAWTTFCGKRLRILGASAAVSREGGRPGALCLAGAEPLVYCGNGCISLSSVQMEGKKIQSAAEWKNGLRAAGEECLL